MEGLWRVVAWGGRARVGVELSRRRGRRLVWMGQRGQEHVFEVEQIPMEIILFVDPCVWVVHA
jgi:hypothetical protein